MEIKDEGWADGRGDKYEGDDWKATREEKVGDAKKDIDPDYLISELEKFFYNDTELATTFENYVKEKSVIIDLDAEEYGLAYTEAHNEYKEMFESRMERQIEKLGATPLDFYRAIQEKTASGKNEHIALFAQILLAVTEFDIFMQMMREAARSFHSDRK